MTEKQNVIDYSSPVYMICILLLSGIFITISLFFFFLFLWIAASLFQSLSIEHTDTPWWNTWDIIAPSDAELRWFIIVRKMAAFWWDEWMKRIMLEKQNEKCLRQMQRRNQWQMFLLSSVVYPHRFFSPFLRNPFQLWVCLLLSLSGPYSHSFWTSKTQLPLMPLPSHLQHTLLL